MTTGRDDLEVRLRSPFRDQADAMPVEPPEWAELCPVAVRRTLPARRVVAAAAVVAALVAAVATTTGGGDATRIRTSPADDAGAGAPTTAAPARAVFSVETRQVSLRADAVTIDAGGLTFSTAPPVQVHGDPGTRDEYTTLELTWTEHGVEMRLFFYFASDGQEWWSDEIRTYDGRSPGEWITYRGEFFRRPLGTAFVGDFDVGEQPPGTGRLRLANAHLEAFRRLPSCDDPGAALVLDPGMSPVVVPGPNGSFGLNVQLLDAASCSVVADQDRYRYAWDSADPGVVSVTTGFVPSELGGRHRDLVSVAPGQTSVRVTATDPDTGAQVAEVAVPVTVLDVPPPSAPAERPPGPPPGATNGAGHNHRFRHGARRLGTGAALGDRRPRSRHDHGDVRPPRRPRPCAAGGHVPGGLRGRSQLRHAGRQQPPGDRRGRNADPHARRDQPGPPHELHHPRPRLRGQRRPGRAQRAARVHGRPDELTGRRRAGRDIRPNERPKRGTTARHRPGIRIR
jgi:hypothetical protein